MDFLSASSVCGQTLLRLVSRGNAIIAELLRLSDFIPPVFRLETRNDREKYEAILPDFSYFRNQDFFDQKIDSTTVSSSLLSKCGGFRKFLCAISFRNCKRGMRNLERITSTCSRVFIAPLRASTRILQI